MHITQITPSATLNTSSETPTDQPPPASERTERYLGVLDTLIDMGAEIAAIVHRIALSNPTEDPGPGFTRIAKVVADTVSLAARILRQRDRKGTLAEQTAMLKKVERTLHDRRTELRRIARGILVRAPEFGLDADRIATIEAELAAEATP